MSPHAVVRVVTTSAALLLWQSGFAQTTGTTPSRPPTATGGTPTTGAGTNVPPANSSTTNPAGTGKTAPGYNPPLFLTGRVVLEDGGPPPDPATIERVCNGQSHAEGYSDSHGNFSIELEIGRAHV